MSYCEAVHDSPTSLILSLWLREVFSLSLRYTVRYDRLYSASALVTETSLTVTLTRKIARHASSNFILLKIPAKIDSRIH